MKIVWVVKIYNIIKMMYVFVKRIYFLIKMNATNNVLKIILILKVYVVIKIVVVGKVVNKHIKLNVFHVKMIFFYMKDNVEQVLR